MISRYQLTLVAASVRTTLVGSHATDSLTKRNRRRPLATLVIAVLCMLFTVAWRGDAVASDAQTENEAAAVAPSESDESDQTASESAEEPKPVIILDHIPEDAALFFAIRPQELFNRRELKVVEELLAIGEPYRHPVPITQIEQMTFVAERRENGVLDNESTLIFDLNILRTITSIDWDEVLDDFGFDLEGQEVDGTKFYKLAGQDNICLWPVDQHTYIAGPEDSIRRAIERHHGDATQSPAQTALPGMRDVQMAVALSSDYVIEQMDAYLERNKDQQGGLKLVMAAVKGVIKDTDTFVASMHLDRQRPLPITLRLVLGCPETEMVPKKIESLGVLLFVFRQYAVQQQKQRIASGAAERLPILADKGEALFEHVDYEGVETSAVLNIRIDAKVGNVVGFIISIVGDLGGVSGTRSFSAAFDRTVLANDVPTAVALPSGVLDSPKLAARREASIEHLQTVAAAMGQYVEDHGHLPSWASFSDEQAPLLSWRVHLLPYLGHEELYGEFHLDEPWNSEHNRKLLSRIPSEYAGPPRGDGKVVSEKASVFVVVGEGTCFPPAGAVSSGRLQKDSASAVLLVEARRDVPWTKPDELRLDEEGQLLGMVYGLHPGGLLVCRSDGSAQFVPTQTAAEALSNGAVLLGAEAPANTGTPE